MLMSNRLKIFPKFPNNLNWLDLYIRDMENLPDELFELSNLETLYIASKELKDLPNKLVSLTNLRLLNIVNTNITTLPNFLFTMPKLNKIVINSNTYAEFNESCMPDRIDIIVQSGSTKWNNDHFFKLEYVNNSSEFKEKLKIDS